MMRSIPIFLELKIEMSVGGIEKVRYYGGMRSTGLARGIYPQDRLLFLTTFDIIGSLHTKLRPITLTCICMNRS